MLSRYAEFMNEAWRLEVQILKSTYFTVLGLILGMFFGCLVFGSVHFYCGAATDFESVSTMARVEMFMWPCV